MDLCLAGYFTHSSLIAFTTTILNSSPISVMKEDICFIRRSIEPSLPRRKQVKESVKEGRKKGRIRRERERRGDEQSNMEKHHVPG
jgi:hypothetical protein